LLISIYDGRENRNHGNQEKGKEKRKEKEVVIARQPSGEAKASPNVFCGADFFFDPVAGFTIAARLSDCPDIHISLTPASASLIQ
jgi:hypothetical protein